MGQGRQTESFCRRDLDKVGLLLRDPEYKQQGTNWGSPIQKHILEHTATSFVLFPKVGEMSKKEARGKRDIRPGHP